VYHWILQHDDRWSFIALYVALAVVLSMWISLFWLVALVGVHFAFECVRQSAAGARGRDIASLAAWEVKLDVALVLFALALSVYMEVALGLLGLQAVARAGAAANASVRAGTRVLAWERAIRGVLLSADDAAQVARVVARRSNGGARSGEQTENGGGVATATAVRPGPADSRMHTPAIEPSRADAPAMPAIERSSGWRGAWGTADRVAVGLAVACIALVMAAPVLTGTSYVEAFSVMVAELHPFPPSR
jgi:hypothetical protein